MIEFISWKGLSLTAMNPSVKGKFQLPYLDNSDICLAMAWWKPNQNNLNRPSLIKDYGKEWDLGRLLSARAAEKVAMEFYKSYGRKVEDVSITQLDKNRFPDWKAYDLQVSGTPVDVKNSRQSCRSKDRYIEHCIPEFKRTREGQEVTISGVFSPYLWPFEILDKPTEFHQETSVRFLGETTIGKQRKLKEVFEDRNLVIDFGNPSREFNYFLPPWIFDYPTYVYSERNKVLHKLRNFLDFALLKEAKFEFNLIPVYVATGINLKNFSAHEALTAWEWDLLFRLQNLIKRNGLSLPFVYLAILKHFLDVVAAGSDKFDDFTPHEYRKFMFITEKFDTPLGIYDPLETIHGLITALETLWTAEHNLICRFHLFSLKNFNILLGKSDPAETSWRTLIAYCGGRMSDGSACGKNPLVLGNLHHCDECGKLICSDCGFCSRKCSQNQSEARI